VRSKLLTLVVGLVLLGLGTGQAAAQSPTGVTITPADLTLNLAKGQAQASTTFTVTNHYAQPVTLTFRFESAAALRTMLFAENSVLTLGAGETKPQTISVQDGVALAPGSQVATLMVGQQAAPGQGVGVAANVRLPLTIIKQDGAITNFGVLGVSTPGFALSIPETVTVHLKNTGNMTVIPRGYVTVTSPNGTTVAQGTVNSSSLALSPGRDFKLQTPLTKLTSATLPGPYRLAVHYGLGSGQTGQQTQTTMWHVAWWHAVTALALVLGALYGLRSLTFSWYRRKATRRRPRPKRALLIGRDIT
jgi:hypothetical protein